MARVTAHHYARALQEALLSAQEKHVPAVVKRFVDLLARRHEQSLLPVVLRSLEKNEAERIKKETLFITAAHEVDSKTVSSIKKSLKVNEDAPVIVLQDDNIVGGVQARYGDTVLEASVPSLFTKWKATL